MYRDGNSIGGGTTVGLHVNGVGRGNRWGNDNGREVFSGVPSVGAAAAGAQSRRIARAKADVRAGIGVWNGIDGHVYRHHRAAICRIGGRDGVRGIGLWTDGDGISSTAIAPNKNQGIARARGGQSNRLPRTNGLIRTGVKTRIGVHGDGHLIRVGTIAIGYGDRIGGGCHGSCREGRRLLATVPNIGGATGSREGRRVSGANVLIWPGVGHRGGQHLQSGGQDRTANALCHRHRIRGGRSWRQSDRGGALTGVPPVGASAGGDQVCTLPDTKRLARRDGWRKNGYVDGDRCGGRTAIGGGDRDRIGGRRCG